MPRTANKTKQTRESERPCKRTRSSCELSNYQLVYGILTAWKDTTSSGKVPINTVYRAFLRLAQDNPKHLSNFNFEIVGDRILSPEVEDALFRLGAAGVVSVSNPRYRYLQVDRGTNLAKKQIIDSRGPQAWRRIERLAEKFAEVIKTAPITVK